MAGHLGAAGGSRPDAGNHRRRSAPARRHRTVTLFLLDTNAASDLLRRPDGRIAEHVKRVGETNVGMSVLVSAELAFGAEQSSSPTLVWRVESLRRRISVLSFEQPADLHYGRLRAILKARGLPIGPNDLLIAAHALALNATLVTDNIREFSRVPGLAVENWLRH
ncbi:MAG: PIN domain-containing protein [Rhizobiaceae bacterium]|nr:PIN domain-containing protein [Rhizobiaceae bacterium]